MISFATRGLLLSLGLVLAVAFAARPALAGPPWSPDICTDPVDASLGFEGSFFGAPKCEAFCKIAAGVCKSAVKNALSCNAASIGGLLKAQAIVCGTLEGAEKVACVADLKDNKMSFHDEYADTKATALLNCAGFLEGCIAGCSMPPE